MNLLISLLLFDSWQIAYGQAALQRLHTYDVLRYEVVVQPKRQGARVDCRITLRPEKPGPIRLFLTTEVEGLAAERDGKPVAASLDEGAFAKVLALIARRVEGVPGLLTLPPAPLGQEVTYRLTYLWKPSGKGLAYASAGNLQTHLVSFWVPVMADEFFDAVLRVESDRTVIASPRRSQVLCLVAGDYETARRDNLEVCIPKGVEADAEKLLDDLEAVFGKLREWFGPALGPRFRLVVEPRSRPSPSFCAGSFAVVHRAWLAAPRERWLAHLAHECSHVWWGHRVASPVMGRGGTWIREGLAEWSGIEVAGALLGGETKRGLWRSCVRGYFSRVDLRRPGGRPGLVFANEPTLIDATYVDDLAVPYLRGALVHRVLEQALGPEAFRAALRRLAAEAKEHLVRGDAFAEALGVPGLAAYYAATSRLPDFEIAEVAPGRVAVRCLDPDWPGGVLPVLVDGVPRKAEMRDGSGVARWPAREAIPPKRVEIDPERVFLDPVRSNSVRGKATDR